MRLRVMALHIGLERGCIAPSREGRPPWFGKQPVPGVRRRPPPRAARSAERSHLNASPHFFREANAVLASSVQRAAGDGARLYSEIHGARARIRHDRGSRIVGDQEWQHPIASLLRARPCLPGGDQRDVRVVRCSNRASGIKSLRRNTSVARRAPSRRALTWLRAEGAAV